ncbi:MAG: PAS domain S-box protein [Thermodesulfovibrionales bacterium]|jgi:PAS domain S-box-containing protein
MRDEEKSGEKALSELKTAEGDLLREKQFSESIINSLPGVFYAFEATGGFIRWNRNFEHITGYSSDEMARLIPLDLFTGEDRKLIAGRIEEAVVRGEARAEAELVTKGGQKIPYYFTAFRMTERDKTYIVGMGIDITERKAAEAALRNSQQELEKRVLERTAELAEANRRLQDQQKAFMEVSVPVAEIWGRIVLVPLIGILDNKRAELLMETLLSAIEEKQAKVAILDISGIPVMDSFVANHLIRTALAARLMGAACIITGVSAGISQTIVNLSIDLSGITTKATMAEGLQTAIAMIGNRA